MITNFEEETYELDDAELDFVPFVCAILRAAEGFDNAINNKYIREQALWDYFTANPGKKFACNDVRLRKIIHYIRVNDLIKLLCANSRGYFVAASYEEAEKFFSSIGERERSIREVRLAIGNQLKQSYPNYQLKLL